MLGQRNFFLAAARAGGGGRAAKPPGSRHANGRSFQEIWSLYIALATIVSFSTPSELSSGLACGRRMGVAALLFAWHTASA